MFIECPKKHMLDPRETNKCLIGCLSNTQNHILHPHGKNMPNWVFIECRKKYVLHPRGENCTQCSFCQTEFQRIPALVGPNALRKEECWFGCWSCLLRKMRYLPQDHFSRNRIKPILTPFVPTRANREWTYRSCAERVVNIYRPRRADKPHVL